MLDGRLGGGVEWQGVRHWPSPLAAATGRQARCVSRVVRVAVGRLPPVRDRRLLAPLRGARTSRAASPYDRGRVQPQRTYVGAPSVSPALRETAEAISRPVILSAGHPRSM